MHLAHQQVHNAVEGGRVGLSQTAQQTLICSSSNSSNSSSSDGDDGGVGRSAEDLSRR